MESIMITVTRDEVYTDAICFWERARIGYNAVLAAIVAGCFAVGWPGSYERLTFDLVQGLFMLAVLANVAYCAAYVADVFVQLSALRPSRQKVRWIVFAVGVLFASIIARFVALSMFTGGGH